MNKNLALSVIIFLIIVAGPVYASGDSDKKDPGLILDRNQSSWPTDFTLVRDLIRRGAFISAAGLLEDMYAQNPDNREIVKLLLNCYIELKAFPKAELLLKRQLEKYAFDYFYHERLLDVYLKSGIDSTIDGHIEGIFERFPGNQSIYRAVIARLVDYGYGEKALNLIEHGRRQFGNESLFALERAALFEIKGDYYAAVQEYLTAIRTDTTAIAPADRKLASLVRHPGAAAEVVRALHDVLDSLPDDVYALKVLQETYTKDGRFEDAFEISIRVDSLTDSKGLELFRYLTKCWERKLFDQVIRMSEYVDAKDFRKELISEYKFFYGEALYRTGRYHDAVAVYDFIYNNYPQARDKALALLEMGRIYRYGLNDFDSARVYYDSVVNSYNISPAHNAAWTEIAGLHLVRGKLDSAETVYRKLDKWSHSDQSREIVAYNLGMIDFYRKNFDDADLAFRKLMTDFPRGFYVNDALINSLIIRESKEVYAEPLSLYAEALYFGARLMPDSVRSRLETIIERRQSPLIGLSTYKLAGFYSGLGDTVSALQTISRMEENHRDDYFYPYALKLKGDILRQDPAGREQAGQIYKELLEKYDSYPFIGEIRETLQQLDMVQPTI
ncbi:MAG: tetratricopeptide repeat protein [Candidatus Zixiibacteriota bacterium]|nr:MAG: tetratricopeptide repeat protein [candidate division Zixibacteria bacterium]